MSLILEALRKLERDKRTPERSLVVTGASDWARTEEHPGRRLAWGAAAVLIAGAAFFVWRGSTAHAPGASGPAVQPVTPVSPLPAAAVPAAAPSTVALAAASPPPSTPLPAAVSTPSPAVPVRAASAPRVPPPADDASDASAEDAGLEPGSEEAAPAASAETPRSDSPAAPGDVVLQAITERDGLPIAIVNGRLVRQGDSFDGIRILRIGAAEIEVEVNGQRRTIGF